MFKDSNILSEKMFFKASKMFSRLMGVWPEDKLLQRKYLFRSVIASLILVSCQLGQFAYAFYNIKYDIKATIETLCTSVCLLVGIIKFIVLFGFRNRLVRLIQKIRTAWFSGKTYTFYFCTFPPLSTQHRQLENFINNINFV